MPAPVQHTLQFSQYRPHLGPSQHDRQPPGTFGPDDALDSTDWRLEYLPEQEQDGSKSLVLGRGTDTPLSQAAHELGDLRRSHCCRMPAPVKTDEAPDPMEVAGLGAGALVPGTNQSADAVQ